MRVQESASVVAAFCAAALLGCGGEPSENSIAPEARAVAGELRGIPQANVTLGDPDAEVVVTVFADPFCVGGAGEALDVVLPTLVQRYARPGRLRVVPRPVTTPGYPQIGVKEAFAASLQNRLWDDMLLFARVRDTVVDPTTIAAALPGLDMKRLRADVGNERVARAAAKCEERLKEETGDVPSMYLDPAGQGSTDIERLPLAELTTPAALERELDDAVRG